MLILGSVFVIVFTLGGTKIAQIRTMIKASEMMTPTPEAVTTTKVEKMQWLSKLNAIGSVKAKQGVVLTSEVPGVVKKILFRSGALVKKGTKLLQMDISTETAELQSARAESKLANLELKRTQTLFKEKARSQADLDTAIARAAQTKATVQNMESIISKKVIRAPFAGQLGIRMMDPGAFLSTGTPIVALEQLDPIFVDFMLPQQALATVKTGQNVTVESDTFGDRTWKGTVDSIDVRVDQNTRNFLVRAIVDNPKRELHPGMFVHVEVEQPKIETVLAIPETAILYAPYGDSVFTVKKKPEKDGQPPQLFAEQVFVRPGERRGDLRAIVSGLKAGEEIVSTGAFKLKNNKPILVDNSLAPSISLKPSLENQ